MKTRITCLSILLIASAFTLTSGCSSATPQTVSEQATAPPKGGEEAAPKATHRKPDAPVETALNLSATTGELQATLTFTATKDLRKAVARFTLPADAQLLDGALESDLGEMTSGDSKTVTISVRAPATGSHVLGGTVIATLKNGRTLAKPVATRIGPDPKAETTRVKTLPDGTKVRLAK